MPGLLELGRPINGVQVSKTFKDWIRIVFPLWPLIAYHTRKETRKLIRTRS